MMESLDSYLLKHYTKRTARSYKREIENYLANNAAAKEYTCSEIATYIGVLRARYSNAKTINRILASIKAWYNYLCFTGARKDNPAKSIQLRDKQSRDVQLQDLFTTEELKTLLTAKKERYTNLGYRNKVLISLLVYQGLKPSEIEALQIDEINLNEATIYIKASVKSSSRTLSLKADQILLFNKYLSEIRVKLVAEKSTRALIMGQRKVPMTAEDITKHIKRNYNMYAPRKVNALTIRQSVIANLLKAGNDLRIVQVFAGHKYTSSTERYKQSSVESLKAAIDKYHPIK